MVKVGRCQRSGWSVCRTEGRYQVRMEVHVDAGVLFPTKYSTLTRGPGSRMSFPWTPVTLLFAFARQLPDDLPPLLTPLILAPTEPRSHETDEIVAAPPLPSVVEPVVAIGADGKIRRWREVSAAVVAKKWQAAAAAEQKAAAAAAAAPPKLPTAKPAPTWPGAVPTDDQPRGQRGREEKRGPSSLPPPRRAFTNMWQPSFSLEGG